MDWDWQVFCNDTITMEPVKGCFGKGGDITYLDWLMSAWGWTATVSVCSLILAIIVGALIGTIRTLPNGKILPMIGTAWVELFRNIPVLVQIFIWYYVVPAVFPSMQALPGIVLVICVSPRRVSPNRCAPASSRCRAASSMPAWRWD